MSARSFDINCTKKQGIIQVTRESHSVCVMLHNTVVIAINESGATLNSGSWRTATTKVAINNALRQLRGFTGYAVVQKKGEWFLSCPDNSLKPFTDGMSINL